VHQEKYHDYVFLVDIKSTVLLDLYVLVPLMYFTYIKLWKFKKNFSGVVEIRRL